MRPNTSHPLGSRSPSRPTWFRFLAAGGIVATASAIAAAQCPTPQVASAFVAPGAGYVLAMDGARAVTGGVATNQAHALHFDGTNWVVDQALAATDTAAGDRFGTALAISGTRILVGAEFHDGAAHDSGAAYVFEFDGVHWVQRAELLANDAAADDHFGVRVAISGNTAMVGAPGADGLIGNSGAVYVFRYLGGAWLQTEKLLPSQPLANAGFGTALQLRGDRAVVGQFAANAFTGAVDLFESVGGPFSWTTHLVAWDGGADDEFGSEVAIDGNHLLVGASYAGAAYFFEKGPAGWAAAGKFLRPDPHLNLTAGVALCGDRAVVGAPGAGTMQSGAAYLLTFDGTAWSTASVMTSTKPMNWFGQAVALSGAQSMIGTTGSPDVRWFDSTCGAWTSTGGGRHSVLARLPALAGSGPLTAWSANTVTLSAAAPNALVALLIGPAPPAAVPFVGSVLQVDPLGLAAFLTTDAAGGIVVNGTLPAGLAGASLVMQAVVVDPTADYGVALSNGLLAECQ